MHSFSARTANSDYTPRIHPALTSFADEVCGTLARLCAYADDAGADCDSAASRSGTHLPDVAMEPAPKALEPGRAHRAGLRRQPAHFTWQNRDLRDLPASRGRPQGCLPLDRPRREAGRRTRNLPPGRRTPPGRLGRRYLAARMDPAGPRELEAAGIIDSKFGAVTLFRRIGGAEDARACLRFYQAYRRAAFADLRLVVPGRGFAGPPRGDRLHAEPAGPADRRK